MSQADIDRHHAAAHAMQTGVMYEQLHDPSDGSPKHLRTGINAAMSDHAGLVALLIEKGLITLDDDFCRHPPKAVVPRRITNKENVLMTEAELAKTFWPGSRKELIVEAVSLLQNRAGEQRIKIGLMMPLSDGKLVGMPSWVGDGFDHIGREDTLETAIKYSLDLKEMSMYIHVMEDSEKPAQNVFNVMLSQFSLRRDPQDDGEEEVADVCLHFVAYVPDNTQFWAWIRTHFRKSIFVRFETTQRDLPIEQAKPDPQMKLGAADHEAARREPTSKKHDAEFAGVGAPKGKVGAAAAATN